MDWEEAYYAAMTILFAVCTLAVSVILVCAAICVARGVFQ